ncbi:ankyrin repeat protein [Penaeus vannamei]|uniref:Ankyrin repeat protein n=1 Tax=Penaeus vannamei TaxID=6689 RepID=A0A3R7MJG9_PENVA|nr:ankyrin repeat protein [Penaeus vannamei]
MIEVLGANVNIEDSNRTTPLHTACFHGQTRVVELLLQSNANTNAVDQLGNTPLHSAITGSRPEIINVLLSHGCDTTIANKEGQIFTHLVNEFLITAVYEVKVAQVISLIKGQADPNCRDAYGFTVLCHASFKLDRDRDFYPVDLTFITHVICTNNFYFFSPNHHHHQSTTFGSPLPPTLHAKLQTPPALHASPLSFPLPRARVLFSSLDIATKGNAIPSNHCAETLPLLEDAGAEPQPQRQAPRGKTPSTTFRLGCGACWRCFAEALLFSESERRGAGVSRRSRVLRGASGKS